MTEIRIPEGFTLASERVPNNPTPVEVIYEPSPRATHFESAVAYHDPDYRRHNPWQTLDNNAVEDYGKTVLAWRPRRDEMLIRRG